MKQLLSIGTDSKTVKGEKKGWHTAILYLVPAGQLGLPNFCPHASEGCRQSCLFTAGRGKFKNVIFSRERKSRYFLQDREGFNMQLHKDIERAYRKHGDRLAVRLNGTSDIPFESVSRGLFHAFPQVQFYDYTKNFKRMLRSIYADNWPSNYHLTFSRSESNGVECRTVLKNGGNVAMVFRKGLPAHYRGYPVINGDESDLRFLDPAGVVVGLTAKGDAKQDRSGFVVDEVEAM